MKKSTMKTVGAFAKSATASLLKISIASEKGLYCHVENAGDVENETIYLVDGFYCLVMTRPEYEAIARPVTGRDPGDWILGKSDCTPRDNKAIIDRAVIGGAKDAHDVFTRAPLAFFIQRNGKPAELAKFYCERSDAVVTANPLFCDCVPSAVWQGSTPIAPLFAFYGDRMAAMVMPIRPIDAEKDDRAVRAFYKPADKETARVSELKARIAELETDRTDAWNVATRLQQENNELTAELGKARAELENAIAERDNLVETVRQLSARIAELEAAAIEPETAAIETAEPETVSDPIPVLTPIDRIAQRFQLDGVIVTVKGAATDSPVIWISGDTKPHKDELKSMGAKWAPKKGAWYYKPAAELAAIEAA